MACLGGSALNWATAVWDKQLPASSHFLTFAIEIWKVFDHPVCSHDATQHLLHLPKALTSMQWSYEHWQQSTGGMMSPLNGLSEGLKDKLEA